MRSRISCARFALLCYRNKWFGLAAAAIKRPCHCWIARASIKREAARQRRLSNSGAARPLAVTASSDYDSGLIDFAWDNLKGLQVMRIVLVRHGQTPWNAEGRYQGRRDIRLSSVGEAQAQALARRLSSLTITHAVASPLLRADVTAQIALGPERAAMLQRDADLQELCHGDWEGCLVSDVRRQNPELLAAWFEKPDTVVMHGGGESLEQLQQRCWRAVTRSARMLSADDVLMIVAHDCVNRVILCRILGLDLAHFWRFRQAPTAINLIEGPSLEQLYIVRLNDCSHHAPLFEAATQRTV